MRRVEVDISIRTDPQRVLDAFTEHHLLKEWWGVERALIQKKPGGVYALAWGISDSGFHYISSGLIVSYIPLRRLEVGTLLYFNPQRPIFGPMRLDIQLEAEGANTLLRLCQDGYQAGSDWDWYYGAVKDAWPTTLGHLKAFLEKPTREHK